MSGFRVKIIKEKIINVVMGVDVSSSCIGWGLIYADGRFIDSGVIRYPGSKAPLRIYRNSLGFQNMLKDFVDEKGLTIDKMVFEEGLYSKPDKSGIFTLGASQGPLWCMAHGMDIDIAFIHVQTWKKQLTGKGSSSKFDVRQFLIREKNIPFKHHPKNPVFFDKQDMAYDESDAVGVAYGYTLGM